MVVTGLRVLVTGGAGYVGSHVVRKLLEAGDEPVVYDNLSTGHIQSVQHAEFVEGDVGDFDRLLETVKRYRFDGAVHLAADSLVGESVRNPSKYFRNNVGKGMLLFDALVSGGVPWVVLSSTAAVYGNPGSIPISENHSALPTSPYGESKLMLERMLQWYGQAYGFRSVALRYFNAAGAHSSGDLGEDHEPETHLIPTVLQAALGLKPFVEVFGSDYSTPDGTAIRDYIHVTDLAQAHVAAMQKLHGGGNSGVYNLGNQTGYSVLEIVTMARHVSGKTVNVRSAPRRPGDPDILVADAGTARVQLGWTPRHDLRSIVASAWEWHARHPQGYR